MGKPKLDYLNSKTPRNRYSVQLCILTGSLGKSYFQFGSAAGFPPVADLPGFMLVGQSSAG